MLVGTGIGLSVTAASALSPGYWWFVVIFACGRPFLSAVTAVSQVQAAEQTDSSQRASAVALVAAGYAVGAGLTAVLYGLSGGAIGYRGILVLAVVPVIALPLMGRRVTEPDRYLLAAAGHEARLPRARRGGQALSVAACSRSPRWRSRWRYHRAGAQLRVPLRAERRAIPGHRPVRHGGGGRCPRARGPGGGTRGWPTGSAAAPTAAGSIVCIGAASILCYSGSRAALVLGYLVGVTAAGAFAPAAGHWPTSCSRRRSDLRWPAGTWPAPCSAPRWASCCSGPSADVDNRFGTAAAVTFLPAMALSAVIYLLPETLGHEPEWFWPDEGGRRLTIDRAAAGPVHGRGSGAALVGDGRAGPGPRWRCARTRWDSAAKTESGMGQWTTSSVIPRAPSSGRPSRRRHPARRAAVRRPDLWSRTFSIGPNARPRAVHSRFQPSSWARTAVRRRIAGTPCDRRGSPKVTQPVPNSAAKRQPRRPVAAITNGARGRWTQPGIIRASTAA